jgi:hypothetical protein
VLLAPAPPTAAGGIAFVIGANQGSNSNPTTGAVDTTGGNFVVVSGGIFNSAQGANPGTVSDSKGNTYTALTARNSGGKVTQALYYCANATCGPGHTFTLTNGFSSLSVAVFSGVSASPFDQQSGVGSNTTSTTIQPGSIAPGAANSLLVTGFTCNAASSPAIGIDSGFTIGSQNAGTGGSFRLFDPDSGIRRQPDLDAYLQLYQ